MLSVSIQVDNRGPFERWMNTVRKLCKSATGVSFERLSLIYPDLDTSLEVCLFAYSLGLTPMELCHVFLLESSIDG